MKKLFLLSILSALLLASCGSGAGEGGGVGKSEDVKKEAVLSCSDGWTGYEVAGTGMQFCYLADWGEPVVEAQESTVGSLNKLSFSNASDGPVLWYLSSDYEGDGSRAVDICFNCLRVTAANEDLQKQMEEELKATNFTVRKTDAGAVRAIRVSGDDLKVYIPNAFDGHHVMVSADKSRAEDLDNFTFDMLF